MSEENKENEVKNEETIQNETSTKQVKAEGTKFEKFSILLRRKWLTNSVSTFIIIVILLAAFVGINWGAKQLDLPNIDVTKNKIYTLSYHSKELVKKIDEDVKIYFYGYTEDANIIALAKQYNKANPRITWEILTDESNPAKVKEYNLSLLGSSVVIFESATTHKIANDSDFYSYDYTTGQEVDTTEQLFTNSIYNVTSDQSPKMYFVTGHGSYKTSDFTTVLSYMANENFTVEEINLITTSQIPDDCDLLAILAPTTDFTENEAAQVINYINKGGSILFTTDVETTSVSKLTNIQSILDVYGAKVENAGYIFENDPSKMATNYPTIIIPELSSSESITSEIYSDGYVLFPYAGKIEFRDDLDSINVTATELAKSTDSSVFVTDLSSSIYNAAGASSDNGPHVLAALATKTFKDVKDENGEDLTSQIVIIADTVFASEYKVEGVSSSYPLSYVQNNKDLFINSASYLTKSENIISIRKDMSTSTYEPSESQNRVVFGIVFGVPLLIIIIGIVVGVVRKRKK